MRYVILFLCSFFIFLAYLGVKQYLNAFPVHKLSGCITAKMNNVNLCPGQDNYITLNQVSPIFKSALLVSEDIQFYNHKGIDVDEIKKSIETNIKKGKFHRGGSTLTQQLIKNVFLTKDKTIVRKLTEMYLTWRVEKAFSKDVILEKYVNVVEFGKGLYGINNASYHYFEKPAMELNVLESAFLVYLLPNPKLYSQIYYKEELTEYSRKRILDICAKMMFFGKIPLEEYNYAQDNIDNFPW